VTEDSKIMAARNERLTAFNHSTVQTRTGLAWMNGGCLLFYVYCYRDQILYSKTLGSGVIGWFATVTLISVLIAASVLGFLAARNPKHETRRKLAKWLSVAAAALAILGCAIASGTSQGAGLNLIGGVVLALPALINVSAYWKPSSGVASPPTNAGPAQESLQSLFQEPIKQVAESLKTEWTRLEQNSRQETFTQSQQSFDEAVTVETKENACSAATVREDVAKRTNYFVRHWRGELSLGVSYWVNGLLGAFVVLLTANFVERQNTISLPLWAALALVVYAIAIVASVWQFVGVWRSASNHVSRGGKKAWATLAEVVVVLGVINCISLFYRTYIPQAAEMVSIITGDARTPPYEIRVLPGGTEIEFRGGLRAGCAKKLEGILSAVPQAKVLHIESPGGRITEAEKMTQLVREHGLITYTSEGCWSAASLVLMSGKERVVAAGAKVGFHAGRLPGATLEQKGEMDNLVRTTMHSAGASEQFIKRVLATPSNQMWYPTFEEMLGAGVVTSQSFGDRFATAPSPTAAAGTSVPSPQPSAAAKLSGEASGGNADHGEEIPVTVFIVSSITLGQGTHFAIINGKTVQEGQQFGLLMGTQTYPMTLKRIEDGCVVLSRHDQEMVVPLQRK